MNAITNITMQLVHIEGPLKGEIQAFNALEIVLGRHPDCQVRFPQSADTLSRKHARIMREGNRFKLIDQSTNGTFVNGHMIYEAYLKEGDVITFSEGGPKIGFLIETGDQAVPSSPTPSPQVSKSSSFAHEPQPQMLASRSSEGGQHEQGQHDPADHPSPLPVSPYQPSKAPPASSDEQTIEKKAAQLVIQFGAAIKSFHTLPITLGKGDHCDFVISSPGLCEQHAQIFLEQDQYWIKDLTDTNAIMINNIPITGSAALKPDFQLALSSQGPKFRFLTGGRLIEMEEPLPKIAKPPPRQEAAISAQPGMLAAIVKMTASLVKKAVRTPRKSEKQP